MKDHRYKLLKILFQGGDIKTFSDIYKYIPKTVIKEDIGTSGTRMDRLMKDPSGFRLQELNRLAGLIGCDVKSFVLMALAEGYDQYKKKASGEKGV